MLTLRTLLPTLALLSAACGSDDDGQHNHNHGADAGTDAAPGEISEQCRNEDRAVAFAPGMLVEGEAGYDVTLMQSAPTPLAKGDHEWQFHIATPEGNPAVGLELRAAPYMPDHGHGTPRQAVPEELGEGNYSLSPVNLFMNGYWTVKVRLFEGETELDSATFHFCI